MARDGRSDRSKPLKLSQAAHDEFAAMGVTTPEPVDEQDEEPIEVMRENWQIVEAFLALATQWKSVAIVGLNGGRIVWTGIDYAAADVVLRRYRLFGRKPLDDLGVMEDAALEVMNGAA